MLETGVEHQSSEILPRALNISKDSKKVVESDTYTIYDMELTNAQGDVIFTYSSTHLNSHMQTRGHKHVDQDEIYKFIDVKDGESGVMLVDSETLFVQKNSIVFVPRGSFHRVINPTLEPMVFETISPGKIQRPALGPKPGAYYSTST